MRSADSRCLGPLPPSLPMDLSNCRVRYEKRGRVAYLLMHAELQRVWDDFEQDDALWIGVLTGEGARAFSVGMDLRELAERNRAGEPPTSFGSQGRPGWPRLTERFQMRKPMIARVNGYAFGGGLELALACDIIVAAEHATFALPESKLGLIPGAGGLFRLLRQIPFKIAMGYLMTGRSFSAARAYEVGLVNEVVPIEKLDDCVTAWVEDILRCAPLSVRAVKQIGLSSMHLPIEEAFAKRYEAEEVRRNSVDSREGPSAFVDKREPKWLAR
jgi:dehydration protein DpgD